MASTPRRPWSEQEAARALADVYQVLLRDHVAEYRQALAQAIDAARDAIAKAADRALGALRPQTRLKVLARRFLIREHLKEFKCADGDFVVHGLRSPC